MLQSAWLFVGVVAVLATIAAPVTPDDDLSIVIGVLGFIAWVMLAYGALDVQVASNGVTLAFSMPAVTIFCVLASLIPGWVALTGPFDVVRQWVSASPDDL